MTQSSIVRAQAPVKSITVSVVSGESKIDFLNAMESVSITMEYKDHHVEERSDLWKTIDNIDYTMTIPADVIGFTITSGPIPKIAASAAYLWSNKSSVGWVWKIAQPYNYYLPIIGK